MATKKASKKRQSTLTQREKDLVSELETAKASSNTGRVTEINRELKRLRFTRMAPKRVTKALRALKQIEKLGNRAGYTYTDEEVAKVLAALGSAVVAVENAFTSASEAKADDFSL